MRSVSLAVSTIPGLTGKSIIRGFVLGPHGNGFAIAPIRAHADREDSRELEAEDFFVTGGSRVVPRPLNHRSWLRGSRQAAGGFDGGNHAAA